MAYIPPNAKWYLATLVQEITVAGDARNIVHKNLILIRANSPEEAYETAHKLGKESEVSYENPNGRVVRIEYRGLNQLNVIYDELEHGAEISFEEVVGMSSDQIQALLRPKEEMDVFLPIEPSSGP